MNDLRKIVISTEDIVTRDDLYIAFLKKLQCNCTEEEKNRIDNLIKFEEVRDGDGREA
jgi:hypothetical protein